jgi:hypothetical protein
VTWLPRIAVGEGEEAGAEDGAEVATELVVGVGGAADGDRVAEGDTEGADVAVVAPGGALCAAA